MFSELIRGYDVNNAWTYGLISNNSAILGLKPNIVTYFTDFPEDVATIKVSNIPAQNGLYEIWPREGIFVSTSIFNKCPFCYKLNRKPFKVLCDMETDQSG